MSAVLWNKDTMVEPIHKHVRYFATKGKNPNMEMHTYCTRKQLDESGFDYDVCHKVDSIWSIVSQRYYQEQMVVRRAEKEKRDEQKRNGRVVEGCTGHA